MHQSSKLYGKSNLQLSFTIYVFVFGLTPVSNCATDDAEIDCFVVVFFSKHLHFLF